MPQAAEAPRGMTCSCGCVGGGGRKVNEDEGRSTTDSLSLSLSLSLSPMQRVSERKHIYESDSAKSSEREQGCWRRCHLKGRV
eukprot:3213572-Pleurochrysis_carterae.AAC.1